MKSDRASQTNARAIRWTFNCPTGQFPDNMPSLFTISNNNDGKFDVSARKISSKLTDSVSPTVTKIFGCVIRARFKSVLKRWYFWRRTTPTSEIDGICSILTSHNTDIIEVPPQLPRLQESEQDDHDYLHNGVYYHLFLQLR
jgi:hypothetical protein